MSSFVHLHTHSDASALDGLSPPQDYIQRAKKLGQPATSLTDHGVLSALPVFYRECRAEGIEPILGLEAYFIPKIDKEDKRPKYQHVTLLALGEPGYRVLCEISTESHRNFYYRPVLDRDSFAAFGAELEWIVCLSGCLAGPLAQAALVGADAVEEEAAWWRKTFLHFYVELMDHKTQDDRKVNARLIKYARKNDLPLVITNDPHFCHEWQSSFHDTLIAIQTASNVEDADRFKFDGEGYWLKSKREMVKAFSGYPKDVVKGGIENTERIAKQCRTRIPEWEKRTWHVPKVPGIDDPLEEVHHIVKDELRNRRLGREYIERARYELKVIRDMDVAGFLLIARDSIVWAKDQGIPVGPGRGSVCGSLVCWLLGIHDIDPIRYTLRFDRFLNPERPRMPDIDTDFGQSRRDEVFEYAARKYGEKNVLGVATFQKMKVRRAFKSLAKSHDIPFSEANRISQELPDDTDEELEEFIPDEILRKHPAMADDLEALVGVKCGFGTHPAGLIIAAPEFKLSKTIPQMWLARAQKYVAQFDLEAFEEMGLLKQDFLGLRTLDTIEECLRLVEARIGERPDPSSWVPDAMPWDEEVYTMIASGRTAGLFQFEGATNSRGAKELGVSSFEDCIACLALYRKGPILSGCTETYIENRRAGQAEYLHPALETIQNKTWGALVYQEQILEIGEKIAGFGPGDANDLLKAVAKKKQDLMASIEIGFKEGCINNDIPAETTDELWDQIQEGAWYLFNRAHAAGYSMCAYRTAVLKHLYPLDFYAALLRTVDDKDKRRSYLREAVQAGYRVLPPDIRTSDEKAMPDYKNKAIRFGFTDIKGVGQKMATRVIKARKEGFSDDQELAEKVNNVGVMKHLADSGTLIPLGVRGKAKKAEELLGWPIVDRMAPIREKLNGKYDPPEIIYGEIIERDKRTTRGGKPYCTWTVRWAPAEEWKVRIWSSAEELFDIRKGALVRVAGRYDEQWDSISVGETLEVKELSV